MIFVRNVQSTLKMQIFITVNSGGAVWSSRHCMLQM